MKITKNELLLYNKKIRNCQFCRINAQCRIKKDLFQLLSTIEINRDKMIYPYKVIWRGRTNLFYRQEMEKDYWDDFLAIIYKNSLGLSIRVLWNDLKEKCLVLPVIRKSALISHAQSKNLLFAGWFLIIFTETLGITHKAFFCS